jgi:Fe-S cluster biogenesis protein NfuA
LKILPIIMKIALYCLAFTVLFFSCQKEPDVDLDPAPTPAAVYTLSGSPNACTVATVAGYYATGTPLSATNTVTVQVNVATAGTYSITTNTVNGYSFAASGTFAATGTQTVVLTGSGTPVTAQADAFTPTSGTAGCTFNVTVVTPAPAVFTYSGAPNGCTVATVNGSYAVATALTAANTVTVQVNVSAVGTYSITTNTVGGMTFAKTGTFAATGNQNVTLIGTGTPTTSGSNTFTVGTNGCTFNVPVVGPAVFIYSGAPNACTVATPAGTYATGTALSASNTVTVEVNVSTAGSYNISTNTVGGMTFSKTGTFTATGVQTVILNGSGTPTIAGLNTFTVGTNGCTFGITVTGPAVYTLSGAPNACTVATIAGTYTVGSTLVASTHTVTVQVNVTTVGAYNISTTSGGMTFSKSGIFTATGNQNVILAGSGTPATAGDNTFTVGTGGCTFVIPVTAPTGTYSCKVDGVFTSFSDRAQADITDDFFSPPTPYLFLDGYTEPPNGGNVPEFEIFITKNNNGPITPGTYNGTAFAQPNGYRIEIDYKVVNPDLSVTIWNTSSTIIPPANPPFTIIVTSMSGGRAKGTFSGTLTNITQGSNLFKVITEGVFDLPIL